MTVDWSRRGSEQIEHGSTVSILPQVEHTTTLSAATLIAAASGLRSSSRFLTSCRAARRAERGPRPGSLASSWMRRSISGPVTAAGINKRSERASSGVAGRARAAETRSPPRRPSLYSPAIRRQEILPMRAFFAVAALLTFFAPAAAQDYGPAVDVPQLMMPGPLGEKGLGSPSAPVTVIEYASMTCPHCQRFHAETFPVLKTKYIDTGKVYFILREFPLDALAFAAFMVARCSGDHYFDVIDTLFDHQEEWAFVADPVAAMV